MKVIVPAVAKPSGVPTTLIRRVGMALIVLAVLVLPGALAYAAPQPGLPLMTSSPAPGGGTNYSLPLQMLLVMTGISFIPIMLLMMTAFTRIVIVLSLFRQALGVMQSPSNQVLIGMALFLTLFVMSPVLDKAYQTAWLPYSENKLSPMEALDIGSKPFKEFMLRQTREKDLAFFIEISHSPKPEDRNDVSLKTLIPAFIVSELKTAFEIGFMVFIPFLIIDLVVATVLMSMGMMMVSPVTISLPFKLMLFVLVDGWTLLMGSLVQSFAMG